MGNLQLQTVARVGCRALQKQFIVFTKSCLRHSPCWVVDPQCVHACIKRTLQVKNWCKSSTSIDQTNFIETGVVRRWWGRSCSACCGSATVPGSTPSSPTRWWGWPATSCARASASTPPRCGTSGSPTS
uniref:Uncharacterized protein n=1 Tax=Aegilops tauschii subsp. strangulata TaxID=200361 RepID=A0A453H054_AEGTS